MTFQIFSNGLSSTLDSYSPYDCAKLIADKLKIAHTEITNQDWLGDSMYYQIGQHLFHISLI